MSLPIYAAALAVQGDEERARRDDAIELVTAATRPPFGGGRVENPSHMAYSGGFGCVMFDDGVGVVAAGAGCAAEACESAGAAGGLRLCCV